MKIKYVVALALFALLSMGSSKASALTYDLVLNSLTGAQTGTGMLTVNGPVSSSGTSVFTAGSGLTSLSLSIDGYNFSLANALGFSPTVSFSNGTLANIAYLGSLNGFQLDLGTSGLNYAFTDFGLGQISLGTIKDPPGGAATPLPPGLPLFITGLVALVLLGWRKKQQVLAA